MILPAISFWRILSATAALAAGDNTTGSPKPSEVPFELGGKVVFLKAEINGKGPYRLILDTGATETVITPPVAKALGIKTTPVTAAQRRGTVQSLAVGSAIATNLGVYVFDPPQALSLRLDSGLDYHGLLGYTFISRFLTTIDYTKSTVRFDALPAPPRRTAPPVTNANTFAFEVVDHLIRVPVRINGSGPYLFMFDTGAAEILIFPPTARAIGLPAPTATAPAPTFPRLSTVSLGSAEISQVSAVVDSQADPRVSANFAGILGYPFLSHFSVTINYRERVAAISPKQPAATGRNH